MLIPARKLAVVLIACASGLLSITSVASADAVGPQFRTVGLENATPLTDQSMSQSRSGGFATGLSGLLYGLMPRAGNAAAPGSAPSNARGSLGSFLPAFLEGLPAINLVAAELNDQPTLMRIGTAPQSLGCGNGLTCPAGMMVSLYANNNAPAGSLALNLNIAH